MIDPDLRARMLGQSDASGPAPRPQVMLTRREFEALLDYSCSLPTGTTIGKRWRRRVPYHVPDDEARWYMGEYFDDGTPDMVAIRWSEIAISDAA